MFKYFLLLFIAVHLFATSYLQESYYVPNNSVMLSNIVKNVKQDRVLYIIDSSRYSKRVRAKELLLKLKSYGYANFASRHAYIQFIKKSPVHLTKIKEKLREYYQQNYPNIQIKKLLISPMQYLTQLPSSYTIVISRNDYLRHEGTLYIKTSDEKKIFFHYNITATIELYSTTKEIERGEEISLTNVKKKSIILDKFYAMPIVALPITHYEAKHRIKKGTLLTKRDVRGLFLIKRGSSVAVTIEDGGVIITFSAKAIQNGRLGDSIYVEEKNRRRLRVVVTGRNRARVK